MNDMNEYPQHNTTGQRHDATRITRRTRTDLISVRVVVAQWASEAIERSIAAAGIAESKARPPRRHRLSGRDGCVSGTALSSEDAEGQHRQTANEAEYRCPSVAQLLAPWLPEPQQSGSQGDYTSPQQAR